MPFFRRFTLKFRSRPVETKVCQQLRFVHSFQFVHGFDFKNKLILDEEVQSIRHGDDNTLICERDFDLAAKPDVGQLQLARQASAIGRLKKPGS